MAGVFEGPELGLVVEWVVAQQLGLLLLELQLLEDRGRQGQRALVRQLGVALAEERAVGDGRVTELAVQLIELVGIRVRSIEWVRLVESVVGGWLLRDQLLARLLLLYHNSFYGLIVAGGVWLRVGGGLLLY